MMCAVMLPSRSVPPSQHLHGPAPDIGPFRRQETSSSPPVRDFGLSPFPGVFSWCPHCRDVFVRVRGVHHYRSGFGLPIDYLVPRNTWASLGQIRAEAAVHAPQPYCSLRGGTRVSICQPHDQSVRMVVGPTVCVAIF